MTWRRYRNKHFGPAEDRRSTSVEWSLRFDIECRFSILRRPLEWLGDPGCSCLNLDSDRQTLQQALGCNRYFKDGFIKRSLICPGRLSIPAHLADELQGGFIDLLLGGCS